MCPQNLKSKIGQTGTYRPTQSRLQVKGCTAERYCLLHVVVQGPESFRSRINFSLRLRLRLRSYGASKLPNFRILAYFSYTKPIKRTFWWPAYSLGMIPIFPCGSRRSKGMPSGTGDFLRLLVGEGSWGPQACPNFRMWQMAIPIHNATTRGVRSGPKTTENAQFWGRMYFPTKYLRTYTQNYPKTPFWGPFNAKHIIQRALR